MMTPRLLTLVSMITACILLFLVPAHGAVMRVKPDGNDANSGSTWPLAKKTLGAAVLAAGEGDEIWVAAGTYPENVANKVVSSGGVSTAVNVALYGGFAGTETAREQRNRDANPTVLDGQDAGAVITISNNAASETRIDGFYITKGTSGIYSFGSAPTITNNVIRGNTGPGIYCLNYRIIGVSPPNVAFPSITYNTIVDNASSNGGGIVVAGSNFINILPSSAPVIAHNLIARNTASMNGGGIGCWGHASPVIANNYILANSATLYEPGFDGDDPVGPWLVGGGGIFATKKDMSGQPVQFAISAPVIINNVIAANAGLLGGGIALIDYPFEPGIPPDKNPPPVVTNNTVVANNGSGIFWGNNFPVVRNNIVAFNTWGLEQDESSLPTLGFNNVYGNRVYGRSWDYKGMADPTGLNGNISADPRMADYRLGEFHLQPGSPCIDAGTPGAVGAGWTDIDSQPRVIGSAVDIGADESDGASRSVPAAVIRVRTDGDDSKDGLSWPTAKKTLAAAIGAAAETGGEVWAAKGTYVEHIVIPAFVYLYGGFAGDETARAARDVAANPTVIDGAGVPTVVLVKNAGYLVSTLDGFTVQNGGVYRGTQIPEYSDGVGGRGGGIRLQVASPYVSNNIVTRNSFGNPYDSANKKGFGAGIHGYQSHSVITGNIVASNEILNWGDGNGAGMYFTLSMPTIEGNVISQNHSKNGSAVHATLSIPRIVGNLIENNGFYVLVPLYTGSGQGAVTLVANEDFLIEGNVIRGNTAAQGAGITVTTNQAGRIQNNLIVNNTASDPTAGNGGLGGGIYALVPTNATDALYIVNNTIAGNTATAYGYLEQGGGIAVSIPPAIVTPPTPPDVRMVIANNIVAFNSSGLFELLAYPMIPPTLTKNDFFNTSGDYLNVPAGLTDIKKDPLFVNRLGGNFHLSPTSPCVDGGDNSAVPPGLLIDIEGNARIYDGKGLGVATVDIGADEYMPSDPTPPETAITAGPTGTIPTRDATFTFSGSDNLSSAGNLLYATCLGGYETSWSGFSTATTRSYTHLPDGSYTFLVKAKDQAGNEDPSPATRTFTVSYVESVPPQPDPMTWATPPYAPGLSSLSMTATEAADSESPPVSYFISFADSPTGGTGGADSGWQAGRSYTNEGLETNHRYGYRVKAKDRVTNETAPSAPARYAYTLAETPSGILFGAVTAASIQVRSAGTPPGLTRGSSGLLVENRTNLADSGWKQDNAFWTAGSLAANTHYSFRAKARNGDAVETGYSPEASQYTLAKEPIAASSSATATSIRIDWGANGNPPGTEYLCENPSAATDSGWITAVTWESTGLTCETAYSLRVKARNGDGVETGWIDFGGLSTGSCDVVAPDAPVGLVSVPGSWTSVNAFEITWTNPSDPSGIAAAWYKIGSVPASPNDGTRVPGSGISSLAGIAAASEGETSAYVWLEDGAGNKDHGRRAQAALRYDATPPAAGTLLIEGGRSSTHSLNVTLSGLGANDLSGVGQMRFSNSPAGPWSTAETYSVARTGWDLSGYGGNVQAGAKTVYVQYRDGAGNWSGSFSSGIDYTLVEPKAGTLGSEFTVWKAFPGAAKGKILVNGVAQKILEWKADSLRCLLSKPPAGPGTYDVTVIPAKMAPWILEKSYTVKLPEVDSMTPQAGKPLAEITLKGNFFGSKKGKILLDYESKGVPKAKSCKVLGWEMAPEAGQGEVVFEVPKGIAPGTYPLRVSNSVGEVSLVLTVLSP
jgi:hypothetical protein